MYEDLGDVRRRTAINRLICVREAVCAGHISRRKREKEERMRDRDDGGDGGGHFVTVRLW